MFYEKRTLIFNVLSPFFFRRTGVKPSCKGQLLKWKARYDISLQNIFTKPFKKGYYSAAIYQYSVNSNVIV